MVSSPLPFWRNAYFVQVFFCFLVFYFWFKSAYKKFLFFTCTRNFVLPFLHSPIMKSWSHHYEGQTPLINVDISFMQDCKWHGEKSKCELIATKRSLE